MFNCDVYQHHQPYMVDILKEKVSKLLGLAVSFPRFYPFHFKRNLRTELE